MDIVTSRLKRAAANRDCISEAQRIYARGQEHPAFATLAAFNGHFAARALKAPELRLLLSSLGAFNRHITGGIAILAGRLSDELLPHAPITGHEIAALVLDTAIDEYGLRETVTHLELAFVFAEYLGIPPSDILDMAHASQGSVALGEALCTWYREKPPAFALGVHIASEMTSMDEFMCWHDIFLKFPQYRFSLTLPEFGYMRAHYLHEPEHRISARLCIGQYLEVLPAHGLLLQEGAFAYLDLYRQMFHELDTLMFK